MKLTWKEAVVAYSEILTRNFPGATDENRAKKPFFGVARVPRFDPNNLPNIIQQPV
jgi:hypothetical protein